MHCTSLDSLIALGLENSLLSGSLAFWDVFFFFLLLQIKNIHVCTPIEFIQNK